MVSGYGKTGVVARVLSRTGLAAAWQRLPTLGERIIILAYHRIYETGDEAAFPFDPELVSATPRDFARQMECVLRYGTPISFRDLGEALDRGQRLPRRPILVTFDDGHRDNCTHAFPVLRALGVPATLFLSTGYIGQPGTFWFDRVAQLLFRAPPGRVRAAAVGFEGALGDVASRRAATVHLLELLKHVPNASRLEALEELERHLGGTAPAQDSRHSGSLTWDQVREMATGGIELGSHAVTHPILTNLDDESLAYELAESKRVIEERTGTEVTAVAYPVGGRCAFDDRVLTVVRATGYRFGVSYVSGVNARARLAPYALKRLHVERYTSAAYFECMLAAPKLFS